MSCWRSDRETRRRFRANGTRPSDVQLPTLVQIVGAQPALLASSGWRLGSKCGQDLNLRLRQRMVGKDNRAGRRDATCCEASVTSPAPNQASRDAIGRRDHRGGQWLRQAGIVEPYLKTLSCSVAARPVPPSRTDLAGTYVNSVIRRVIVGAIVVGNEADPAIDGQRADAADPSAVFP